MRVFSLSQIILNESHKSCLVAHAYHVRIYCTINAMPDTASTKTLSYILKIFIQGAWIVYVPCVRNLQTLKDRREYFLCVLMFNYTHGCTPKYLWNYVIMHVDISEYGTKIWIYTCPLTSKKIAKKASVICLEINRMGYILMISNL